MAVTWLHVSDFHIRTGDGYDRNVVLKSLVASVKRFREQGRAPDLVFATGDIAFSGKEAEYALATEFFDELLGAVALSRERLFVIPGNHDVDRDLGKWLARTLASREDADDYFDPAAPKIHLTQKLAAYVVWHDEFFRGIRTAPTNTTCGPVEAIEINGTKLGILPINTALFCWDDEDHAKLVVGRRALEPALEELRALRADLNVGLIHHPLDWLNDVERSNIRASLQANVDVLLRGHLHESDVESTVSASGGFLHVAAGAAYQTRKWPNRALYGTFDRGEVKVFPIRYEDQPREVWVVDPSVFPEDAGHERAFAIPRLAVAAPAANSTAATAVAPPPPPLPPAERVVTAQFRSNIQSRHNLPFVGRDRLLAEMRVLFADTSAEAALVLHGQPGVGKSELAREYARQHRQLYPGGTFVISAAGGGESVDLAHIGKVQLGLEFPADLSIQDQAERTLLSLGASPVLLIYDNVGAEEDIGRWLPPAGIPCHVVVTTNSERWGPRWHMLEVEPLLDAPSLSLVTQLAGDQVAERFGDELVRIAEGLPVQLVPAAIALAYEERRGRLDEAHPGIAPQAIDSFRVPYESLGDPERLLLHSAAFLNTQRIIRQELSNALAAGAGWNEDEFRARMDACLDLHVLEGGEVLRMHQLFASFIRTIPATPEFAESLRRVRAAQRNRVIEVAQALANRPARTDLATVLNGFQLRPEEWVGEGSELPAVTGEIVGRALHEIGAFDLAQPWFERAAGAKQQGDEDGRVNHESLSTSLHQVGACLSRVGEYEDARLWFERAVEEAQKGDLHGQVDHKSLSASLHQVGYCLSSMGKYEEARLWYERAVREAQMGDIHGRVDHESLGTSLHAVGYCLLSVGKYEEAQPWYERAVEEAQQGDVLGRVDHASVGMSLREVGICLFRTGKYEEALSWYERAVWETQQGDVHGRVDHESLGISFHAIGICLSKTGKHEEARHWYELAVEEAPLGDVYGRVDHMSLGVSLNAVGSCLKSVGQYKEACAWFERAMDAMRVGNLFGRVDTLNLELTMRALAECLRELGRTEEAQQWEDAAAELVADEAPGNAEPAE
ncbi:MAG TPA: tetratricopeptide repeat protein [Longimicrobium sp.]|jgi:tetratricopeptide (TPR) repeat protein/predicted phosphodiesterase